MLKSSIGPGRIDADSGGSAQGNWLTFVLSVRHEPQQTVRVNLKWVPCQVSWRLPAWDEARAVGWHPPCGDAAPRPTC
jgi:hypothetical protein